MQPVFGVRSGPADERKTHVVGALLASFLAIGPLVAPTENPANAGPDQVASVIVRELPGAGSGPELAVEALGGQVGQHLGIIRGFEARLLAPLVGGLERVPGVHSVTPNSTVHLLTELLDPLDLLTGWDGESDSQDRGSMSSIANVIGAHAYWSRGFTGEGVDVALIDTGVLPVYGLAEAGKVVNGPDLSFESQSEELRYLDTYGHGTHIGGIIAGRGGASSGQEGFRGVAPDARIVSVKVGNAFGTVDVSQVIAAIDWVVRHRRDHGLNIGVLNLAFGTDGVQQYVLDPLAYAAEVAWRKGIVVVVASGNEGFGSPKLNNPAYDPYLLAVGAEDPKGTPKVTDDTIPDWSSRGDASRHPDLVAPAVSITSLRAPGSHLDLTYPEARRGERFFKGSGTSQAAAVASGAAALILQQRPGITPDQVKALLTATAAPVPEADPVAQGAGLLNLKAARDTPTPDAVQVWPQAGGGGQLEAARGSGHVVDEGGIELAGEGDIFGHPWFPVEWVVSSWNESSWQGGTWNGNVWSGSGWTGQSWAYSTWEPVLWKAPTWSGQPWSEQAAGGRWWTGKTWAGEGWGGKSWGGKSWGGKSWGGKSWSSVSWG